MTTPGLFSTRLVKFTFKVCIPNRPRRNRHASLGVVHSHLIRVAALFHHRCFHLSFISQTCSRGNSILEAFMWFFIEEAWEGKKSRRLMLPAIPNSSHARTVPGPASLSSDSTTTSVPMVDGSSAANFDGLLPSNPIITGTERREQAVNPTMVLWQRMSRAVRTYSFLFVYTISARTILHLCLDYKIETNEHCATKAAGYSCIESFRSLSLSSSIAGPDFALLSA